MNRMQKFLVNKDNKHIILEIIKKFHPDFPEYYISPHSGKKKKSIDWVRVTVKYDWVCIDGPGVSIGIEFPVSFWGTGWKLKDFVEELENNQFRVWRFSLDKRCGSKYDFESSDDFKKSVHKLLIDNKVPKPTPKEMFNYYYSD